MTPAYSADPVQPKALPAAVLMVLSCSQNARCLRCRNALPSLWEQIPLPDLHEPETIKTLYQGQKKLSSYCGESPLTMRDCRAGSCRDAIGSTRFVTAMAWGGFRIVGRKRKNLLYCEQEQIGENIDRGSLINKKVLLTSAGAIPSGWEVTKRSAAGTH